MFPCGAPRATGRTRPSSPHPHATDYRLHDRSVGPARRKRWARSIRSTSACTATSIRTASLDRLSGHHRPGRQRRGLSRSWPRATSRSSIRSRWSSCRLIWADADERQGDPTPIRPGRYSPLTLSRSRNWVRWSVDLFNIQSQQTASQVYHLIPASGSGVAGHELPGKRVRLRHHEPAKQIGHARGYHRLDRVRYPRDNVTGVWVGTNDTGANWPHRPDPRRRRG